MDTREKAVEYRLSHWAGIMRDRKERGMSIRVYCRQSGIHENVYYYWQRKLREAACRELTGQPVLQSPAPAGWALCHTATGLEENGSARSSNSASADQIVIEVGDLRLTVGREYPPEHLSQLLRGLMRSC